MPISEDEDVYFPAELDFQEGPPVGADTDMLPDDGRGGTVQQRRKALEAMRAAVMADSSADDKRTSELEDRSDMTLERFLRARGFDVRVAAALFIEHRKWRQSFGWRVKSSEMPVQLPSNLRPGQTKSALQALCRRGLPLMIIIGRHHITTNCDIGETKRFVIYTIDKAINALHPGQQFHVLVDLKGLTRQNADIKAIIASFDILQARYVERCAHIWFTDPPVVFWAIWKVVSPFVAPSTRAKIAFMYGEETKRVLTSHFDPKVVPKDFGGEAAMSPTGPGPAPWELEGAPRLRRY